MPHKNFGHLSEKKSVVKHNPERSRVRMNENNFLGNETRSLKYAPETIPDARNDERRSDLLADRKILLRGVILCRNEP